jgi:hypothetical protein
MERLPGCLTIAALGLAAWAFVAAPLAHIVTETLPRLALAMH